MPRPPSNESPDERRTRLAAEYGRGVQQRKATADARRAAAQPAIDAAQADVDAARAAVVAFDAQHERRELVEAWRIAHRRLQAAKRTAMPKAAR